MDLFINYSNHPMSKWSEKQLNAAKEMADKLIDIPFPQIDPEATEDDIISLANEQLEEIEKKYGDNDTFITIHIAGELTYTAYFVSMVNRHHYNIACVSSTSKRNTVDNPDGTKTVKFEFVKFRLYVTTA